MVDVEKIVGRLTQDETMELAGYSLEMLTDENQVEAVGSFLQDNHDIRDEIVMRFEGCLDEEE